MSSSAKVRSTEKRDVFVSHAAADRPLVDAFVDLLDTGLELSPKRIFCSSLDGLGIPSGANFKEYIRQNLEATSVVILLLSPNYFASQFCLGELGASWVMSHWMIPILVPPCSYADMKAILGGVHGRKIDDESGLSEIRDELVEQLTLDVSSARWDAKKKKFLKELPALLKSLPAPDSVDIVEHRKLKATYDESIEQLEEAFSKIESLEAKIESIKKLKNAKEVAAFEIANSNDWELFEKLCQDAKTLLGRLPRVVCDVAFHELTGREFRVSDSWDDRSVGDEVRNAEKEDLLEFSGSGIELNRSDPTVYECVIALEKIRSLLNGAEVEGRKLGDEFFAQYIEEHDHRPAFNSKQFWRSQLAAR